MIILVHDDTEKKKEELLSVCRTRYDLFHTTSNHLALFAADDVERYVVFDRPYGVLGRLPDGSVQLLDLEHGVERYVMQEHLDAAIGFGFVLHAF